MTVIHRYPTDIGVTTPLDPIEDVTSWISGLRSTGYVSDVLKEVHGFSNSAEIKTCSGLIALFSATSVGLIEQAYSGPPELSFLPLYYSILNLSKIYVVLNNQRGRLDAQRMHGGTYNPNRKLSRDLLTEKFQLRERGVFQLFYEAVTGEKWTTRKLNVQMSDIYPYVPGITHEFSHAYKRFSRLQQIALSIENPSPGQFRLEVKLGNVRDQDSYNPRFLRLFTGFRSLEGAADKFVSPYVSSGSIEDAQVQLSHLIRRCLLYHLVDSLGNLHSLTPISSMRILLPPEVPIWLAFFHLSNVVRYNPEFLDRLVGSKSWPMLLASRRHSILAFMLNFWSFLHQANYHLIIQ